MCVHAMLAAVDEEGSTESPTRCQNVDKKKLCASFVPWLLLVLVILQMTLEIF